MRLMFIIFVLSFLASSCALNQEKTYRYTYDSDSILTSKAEMRWLVGMIVDRGWPCPHVFSTRKHLWGPDYTIICTVKNFETTEEALASGLIKYETVYNGLVDGYLLKRIR